MLQKSTRIRRAAYVAGFLAASVIAVSGPTPISAGPVPGGVLYDLTCGGNILGTNTGPIPTPILVEATNIAPDPAFPTGTAVAVTGNVTVVVLGALQAGLFATLPLGANNRITAGEVDVSASNSLSGPTTLDLESVAQPNDGRQLAAVSTTAGDTTVTSAGLFLPSDVGKSIASNAQAPAAIANGSAIVAYLDADTVVLNQPAVATNGGVSAGIASDSFFFKGGVDLGTYTSDGVDGGAMAFQLEVGASTGLIVDIGGIAASFNQTNDWDLDGDADPLTNPFSGCFLVDEVDSPIPGAQNVAFGTADLVDTPPNPVSQNLNVGTDTVTSIFLNATSTDPTLVTSYTLVTLPAAGALAVAGVPAATGVAYPVAAGATLEVVYTSGLDAEVVSFEFSASDGVNPSVANGIITLNVGSPPVTQDITQEITAGQLVLSCSAPGSLVYPLLVCPPITFTPVELDGTNQTRTEAMNTIYVVDNRGDVAVGWSLSAQLVEQDITGGGQFLGLVNTNVGADTSLSANQIEASWLVIGNIACAAVSPAPAATVAGSGGAFSATQGLCSADAGTGMGQFTANGDLTLTSPSSKAAGTYEGTIQYLVL